MDYNQPQPQPAPAATPPTPNSPEPTTPNALNHDQVMDLITTQPSSAATQESGSGSGFLSGLSAIFFGILNWIIIPIIIVFVLHNFVFQAFHVVGSSMIPSLKDTDYIIVSKVGKTISGFEHQTYIPHRYDIVVFHYPKDPSLIFVKRVIGLPGERVVVKDNHVTVYNTQNPEGLNPDTNQYKRAAETTLGAVDDTVPQGSIFVLGDNRTPSGSYDSRDWGFLPSSYIVGTASIRLLPLDQFRLFSVVQAEINQLSRLIAL